MSFNISPVSAVCGVRVADIPFPEQAAALLVVRGDTLLAPRGPTVLESGDHVYVFCRLADRPLILLLFGRQVET
jgi:potassium/hydrogen antiporter